MNFAYDEQFTIATAFAKFYRVQQEGFLSQLQYVCVMVLAWSMVGLIQGSVKEAEMKEREEKLANEELEFEKKSHLQQEGSAQIERMYPSV